MAADVSATMPATAQIASPLPQRCWVKASPVPIDPHYLWLAKVEETLTFESWQWFGDPRGSQRQETEGFNRRAGMVINTQGTRGARRFPPSRSVSWVRRRGFGDRSPLWSPP